MDEIYIAISMDCERGRIFTHPNASGPEDFVASEGYVRAYFDLAGAYGFPVSFFLHPEVAEEQSELFLDLESKGGCLGLHLHPWKFGDRKYQAHLGGLSEEDQRAVISEAAALWQRSIGRRPEYFRPGTFSANDATFRVLVDLGFRGGSISAPGRVYEDLNSIWTGAVKDPHRANPIFRQRRGTLDFANIPLTHDYSTLENKNGRLFHRDLRPDYEDADYHKIASNIVEQIMEREPEIPMITMVTHNDHDYTDPNDRVRKNYDIVLEEISSACERAGLRTVGTTIDKICDMILGTPVAEDQFVHA
ncbi:MAG: polysaccharide deacetylase family protein [Trueperaceae bacterium]